MNVPFFNYPWVFKQHEEEILEAIKNTASKGAFILQEELSTFEKNISEFIGAKYVFGVADGTNALILVLRAADIGPSDEVIVPSHTYIASAAAIHYVGAKPVPVDCRDDHMVDPDSIIPAINGKTKAIMPVQLNGRTCEMDAIQKIATDYNLLIVEDAAQALGSRYKGKSAATFGVAGTYSFYPAKLLGCFGDGGAVATNNEEFARKIALLRDHGRNEEGEVIEWGTNSRLDNLQAAVLNVKLKYYVQDIDRRREIAASYHDQLKEISQLQLPPGPDDDKHYDVYQNYEIEADRRDDLKEFLRNNEIGTLVQFGGKAVHQHKELGFEGYELPRTEKLYERALLLPMNTSISNNDVDYVCENIRHFYKQ